MQAKIYYARFAKNPEHLVSDLGPYNLDVFCLDLQDDNYNLVQFNSFGGEQEMNNPQEIVEALRGSQLISEKLGSTLLSEKNRDKLSTGINEGREVTINWVISQGITLQEPAEESADAGDDDVPDEDVPF